MQNMATDDVIIQCTPTREEEEAKGKEETETAKEVEAEKREEELVEATEGEGEGEGRGGKLLRLRRKWSLSPKTPYERPLLRRPAVVQLTNANVNSLSSLDTNDGSPSWLSRIAAGAGKLLSSVFRWNEASSSSSAASEYSSEEEEEGDSAEKLAAVESERTADGCKESEQSLALGIRRSAKLSAIEEVLADKTFTWDEFVYLTELLQSRIVDNSLIREPGFLEKTGLDSRSYPRHTAVEEAHRWSEERKKALEESTNSRLHTSLCSNLPNVNLSSDILENSTLSRVDIAKAYMGVQPAWASSSSPQVLKFDLLGKLENLNQAQPSYLLNGIQSSATAPRKSLSTFNGEPEEPVYDMLKRRSSEIEDNWASVGTSRRIRQKSYDIEVEAPASLEARDDEMKFSQPSGSCQEPDKIDGDLDKKLPIPNENTASPENVAIVECSKQSVTPLDWRATVELDNNIENAINGNDERKTLAATESTGLEDITTSVAAVVSVFESLKESTQTEGVPKGASFTDVNNSVAVPDENHSVPKMTNLVSSNEVSHNFSIRQLTNKDEATAGKTSNGVNGAVAEASVGTDEGTIENAELSTPVTSGRRLLTKRVVSKSRFASNPVSKAESSTRRKRSYAPKEAKSRAKKNNASLEKSSDAAEAGGAVRRIRRVRYRHFI